MSLFECALGQRYCCDIALLDFHMTIAFVPNNTMREAIEIPGKQSHQHSEKIGSI